MAGSNNFSDLLKNSVTEKVINSIGHMASNGKKDERTLFGVKLSPEEFEKVSHAIAGAASTIGPIIARSREKTVEAAQTAAQNAPSFDKFEEQFAAAIGAIDKRQAEARERVKLTADSAREATTHAAADARDRVKSTAESAKEATTHVAADARERVKATAESAKDATTHAAADARDRVKVTAETAKEATSHAAAETADASKNLAGLLFWLAAAGAAIYYLILNPERREQVLDMAKSSMNVARGIVSEVRGEDGVFPS
jgi:hypothetical protein